MPKSPKPEDIQSQLKQDELLKIDKYAKLSNDGKHFLARIPKEIEDELRLEKGDKLRFFVEFPEKGSKKMLKIEFVDKHGQAKTV